jgi:hypothetical protein
LPASAGRKEKAMGVPQPQNFANHRRLIPLYHFVIFGILVVNLGYQLVTLYRQPSFPSVLAVLVAMALLGLSFYTRIFVLTVQDRVIRLEMRLRLNQVLPPDLRDRIEELSRDQYIALRFASDAELPDLVREVLTNRIQNRDEIKRRIRSWEADNLRA